MVWQRCMGVSQWFCYVAHGVHNGFVALRMGLTVVLLIVRKLDVTPLNVKYCHMFGVTAKQ